MTPEQLRFALAEIGISQADFAKLIDVTPRAISLWMSTERGIPGTVEAYLRVLTSIPSEFRNEELSRIRSMEVKMRDGIYHVEFVGRAGNGIAVLTFDGGRVYGTDVGKGQYDGAYAINSQSKLVEVDVKVTMPANYPSVIGIVNPYDWSLAFKTEIDPAIPAGDISIRSQLGHPLKGRYEFIRPLPN